MRSVWLHELTSDDVEEYLKRESTVIVPIGSTESHGPHPPMELPGSHVFRNKGHRAFVKITPVVADHAVLNAHLLEKRCVRLWGENQCKCGLQAVFHDKVNDLIKNLWRIPIQAYDKGAHHSDLAFMKTPDTFRIFLRFIRKLMHVIDVRL